MLREADVRLEQGERSADLPRVEYIEGALPRLAA